MISFLSDHIPRKEHVKLVECQHLIAAKWKSSVTQDSDICQSQGNANKEAQEITQASVQTTNDSETAIQTLIQELKCLVQ